jgi:hypothetical protein
VTEYLGEIEAALAMTDVVLLVSHEGVTIKPPQWL